MQEIINPLLASSILFVVRVMSGEQRRGIVGYSIAPVLAAFAQQVSLEEKI